MNTYSAITTSQRIALCAIAFGLITVNSKTAFAQLPADFHTLAVTTNYPPGVAGGYVFLTDEYKSNKLRILCDDACQRRDPGLV